MGEKTPEPVWHSVKKDGAIELRDYDPMIIAETTVTGERYAAINAGFRILIAYISGDNTAQTKIAMTAPVTQESKEAQGQKIPMTAPVTQQESETKNAWQIRFVMPSAYALDSLPAPSDTRIHFVQMPALRVAVIRFSGFNTDGNLSDHLTILMNWLNKQNIVPLGPPSYAFYDPPWKLPFLKRNEIMIRISE